MVIFFSKMTHFFLFSSSLVLFFFICSKLFLSSYIKNHVKYLRFQVSYFCVKVIISSFSVFLFCNYYESLKKLAIITSLVIFIICHFIEGFIVQKKIVNNVKK
ncbi:MAG: hypothetical protein CMG59_00195 [Candidatus Marinimicrobia bacterium]|nr:hypothetical protein [Candidatus Neomarinimicrobiota bacterium]